MNTGGSPAAIADPDEYKPPLALNGTASLMWRAGDDERVIRLTDGGYKQTGSAWSTLRVTLERSFESTFTAHIRNGKAGADGIAFLIQGEGPRALGGWGGGLGYRGIGRSVAVEFDTYQNSSDPSSNHLAVVFGGHPDKHAAQAPSPVPLYGKPFRARVKYDAGRERLTVHVRSTTEGAPEKLVLNQKVDLADRIGTDIAWVGFTGATGELTARQDIYQWSVGSPKD
ncbi:L-type lectin-domain containing protein [Actinoplanes derwentensis]|uniref:L-type lectin-domain containing protein n=1 Tax=Actinoplanes derwentensis TaxID=113562 RepID=UPI001A47C5FC|nr:L-type lectin-domain containing protein [Actinoplanes derwentensis]GID89371.1 hypothetical protein Ade03nite_82950 [Actinoplanes derwentensis]